jgi:hypothetical protein
MVEGVAVGVALNALAETYTVTSSELEHPVKVDVAVRVKVVFVVRFLVSGSSILELRSLALGVQL